MAMHIYTKVGLGLGWSA